MKSEARIYETQASWAHTVLVPSSYTPIAEEGSSLDRTGRKLVFVRAREEIDVSR